MLHSGSRNIGNKTAQYYDDVAAKELKQKGITVSQHLHYMEVDSEEGQSYLQVLTNLVAPVEVCTSCVHTCVLFRFSPLKSDAGHPTNACLTALQSVCGCQSTAVCLR